jgi:hypothetical protein
MPSKLLPSWCAPRAVQPVGARHSGPLCTVQRPLWRKEQWGRRVGNNSARLVSEAWGVLCAPGTKSEKNGDQWFRKAEGLSWYNGISGLRTDPT